MNLGETVAQGLIHPLLDQREIWASGLRRGWWRGQSGLWGRSYLPVGVAVFQYFPHQHYYQLVPAYWLSMYPLLPKGGGVDVGLRRMIAGC